MKKEAKLERKNTVICSNVPSLLVSLEDNVQQGQPNLRFSRTLYNTEQKLYVFMMYSMYDVGIRVHAEWTATTNVYKELQRRF